jgi:peptidoglycan/xylan/chitin deacetylase (PgdA/CDA1 family)
VEQAIEMIKKKRPDEIEHTLSELSMRWNLDQNPQGRAFLSWEEVREMRRSGFISYGSHTASHRILTTLTEKEIRRELIVSKEKLIAEKVVDNSYTPFCYPNGNYSKSISNMVKEAGYSLAVTTEPGWTKNGSNPYCFRRIPVHQDMTSTEAMLGCRIVGLL